MNTINRLLRTLRVELGSVRCHEALRDWVAHNERFWHDPTMTLAQVEDGLTLEFDGDQASRLLSIVALLPDHACGIAYCISFEVRRDGALRFIKIWSLGCGVGGPLV